MSQHYSRITPSVLLKLIVGAYVSVATWAAAMGVGLVVWSIWKKR